MEVRVPESFMQFLQTGAIPAFDGQGRYPAYDKHWNRVGLTDGPQYPGQLALRFPPEWSPFMCFMANGRIGPPISPSPRRR